MPNLAPPTVRPSARRMVDLLEHVSVNTTGYNEDESWRLYHFSSRDFDSLWDFLRESGHEDLYETMNALR